MVHAGFLHVHVAGGGRRRRSPVEPDHAHVTGAGRRRRSPVQPEQAHVDDGGRRRRLPVEPEHAHVAGGGRRQQPPDAYTWAHSRAHTQPQQGHDGAELRDAAHLALHRPPCRGRGRRRLPRRRPADQSPPHRLDLEVKGAGLRLVAADVEDWSEMDWGEMDWRTGARWSATCACGCVSSVFFVL
jgi:hypothetical protein